MFCREIVTVYCVESTKLINIACGKNVEFFAFKLGGKYI
jgi:hypothetical protein